MSKFNKVAVVGTGLIGGSMALAIKEKKLSKIVVGVSRHKSSIEKAIRIKAIDKGSTSLDIIKGSDLVILATPVSLIIAQAGKIAGLTNRDCLVMDVGSTKEKISTSLKKIFPNYVGTHPLAGSEKRGIEFADPRIFKGSLCILTPNASTNRASLARVKKLWHSLGARTVEIKSLEHDRAMAFVSHLPHVAAFALMSSVPAGFLKFGASGLKDTTRIAASDPKLWADILLSNKKNILAATKLLKANINSIENGIKADNKAKLAAILKRAKTLRESLK